MARYFGNYCDVTKDILEVDKGYRQNLILTKIESIKKIVDCIARAFTIEMILNYKESVKIIG